jgi:hypothetical protein
LPNNWNGDGYRYPQDHGLSGKIGELEVGLAETRSDVGAIRRELHGMSTGLQLLNENISKLGVTNWPAIASVAAVMVTMMIAFAAFFGTGIAQNQSALGVIAERFREHELKEGHPEKVLTQTKENKDNIVQLQALMQREVDASHRALTKKIESMEARIKEIDAYGSRRWNSGVTPPIPARP